MRVYSLMTEKITTRGCPASESTASAGNRAACRGVRSFSVRHASRSRPAAAPSPSPRAAATSTSVHVPSRSFSRTVLVIFTLPSFPRMFRRMEPVASSVRGCAGRAAAPEGEEESSAATGDAAGMFPPRERSSSSKSMATSPKL